MHPLQKSMNMSVPHPPVQDVEGAAATSSPAAFVDPQQLARLHAVLTPFMLRRVKADVVAEMVPKTEVMVECKLSR